MIQIINNEENFRTQIGWLTSFHHFSFGEHYSPDKINFGPLRVFNDDLIQPGKGFDFHQHHDMEIVTYVIDGALHHKDNLGNDGVIQEGEVQRMTAGTGVFHSEYNDSKEKPLRLLQIWIFANKKGLKPSWEQKKFSRKDRLNKLLLVIKPEGSQQNSSLSIHQDVFFYISSLENGNINYELKQNRQAYFFVIDGEVKLGKAQLKKQNTAKIENESSLSIEAVKPSELFLIDLPVQYTKNSE